MLPFDRPTILSEARRRGYQAAHFEKAARLLHILDLVGQDPVLGKALSLRGGTAINFFHLPGPRLSVDADLCYIEAEEAESMRRARPDLEARVRQIAEAEGYAVTVTGTSYALGALELRYETVHAASDFLKIEINYLMRVPLAPTAMTKALELLPGVGCTIRVGGKEEVYAGKLKALIQRVAERDLFDVDRLLREGHLADLSRIRYLVTFLLATDEPDARTLRTEQLTWPGAVGFMNAIHPMVREQDRRTLAEVRGTVEPLIRDLLAWDPRQRAFLDAVAARQPDAGAALFPSHPDLAARTSRHPALVWRYTNPRANPGQG